MTELFLLIFGVWAIAVGIHENAATATHFVFTQKAFTIWIFGLAVLYGGTKIPGWAPVIKPLAMLALTALALGRYKEVVANIKAFKLAFHIPTSSSPTTSPTTTDQSSVVAEAQKFLKFPLQVKNHG